MLKMNRVTTIIVIISHLLITCCNSTHEPPSKCHGVTYFKIDQKCGSYEYGQSLCESQGGDLAIIEDETDLAQACHEAFANGGGEQFYMIDAKRAGAGQWETLTDGTPLPNYHIGSPVWNTGQPDDTYSQPYVGVKRAVCKLHDLKASVISSNGVLCQKKIPPKICSHSDGGTRRDCDIILDGTRTVVDQVLDRELLVYDEVEFYLETTSNLNTVFSLKLVNDAYYIFWTLKINFHLKKVFIDDNLIYHGSTFPFEFNKKYKLKLLFLTSKIILEIHYGHNLPIHYESYFDDHCKITTLVFVGRSKENCKFFKVSKFVHRCCGAMPDPSKYPSLSPTTEAPSGVPSESPTVTDPTTSPTYSPITEPPSGVPSESPTVTDPTTSPTYSPSYYPSMSPTTLMPSFSPTEKICSESCWGFEPNICYDESRTSTCICGNHDFGDIVDLQLSLANRLYGECDSACVYSINDLANRAYRWDPSQHCYIIVNAYDQTCYTNDINHFIQVEYRWEHRCNPCTNLVTELTPCDKSEKRSNFIDCSTGKPNVNLFLGLANGFFSSCACDCLSTYPEKIPYEWNSLGKCWSRAYKGYCTSSSEKHAVEKIEKEVCGDKIVPPLPPPPPPPSPPMKKKVYFSIEHIMTSVAHSDVECKQLGGELAVIYTLQDLNQACNDAWTNKPHTIRYYVIDAERVSHDNWVKFTDRTPLPYKEVDPLWNTGQPQNHDSQDWIGVRASVCRFHDLLDKINFGKSSETGILCQKIVYTKEQMNAFMEKLHKIKEMEKTVDHDKIMLFGNDDDDNYQEENTQTKETNETNPQYPFNIKYVILSIIFVIVGLFSLKIFRKNKKNIPTYPHETTPLMELINKC